MDKKTINPNNLRPLSVQVFATSDSLIRKIEEKEDSIMVTFKARPNSSVRVNIKKDTIVDWCETYCDGGTPAGFKTLLEKFSSLLPATVERDSATWQYLLSGYIMADDEWKNGTLGLFDTDNFPEIFEYRGDNDQYETDGTSYTAMQAWLMAMCLAELAPTYGAAGETNRQTDLYRKAYELGGGKDIPLYGGYTIKGDVMASRLVAAAIYAINRAAYSFDDMDDMRDEISGSRIDLTGSWTDLGYDYANNIIGYDIALDSIFPSAPGPFLGSQSSRRHPSEQPDGLFYTGDEQGAEDWWAENYMVDVDIDEEVRDHYNLEADDDYLARTVQAKADELDNCKHWFAERTYYKYSTGGRIVHPQGPTINNPRFTFEPGTEQDNDGSFDGTFSSLVTGKDLSDIISDQGGHDTAFSYFMGGVGFIGSAGRLPLLDAQYGRRRPAMGTSDQTARCSSGNNYNRNYLDDSSISRLVGGGTEYDADGNPHTYFIDSNGNGQYDNGEPYYNDGVVEGYDDLYPAQPLFANTYPSGHSAGVWSTAMFVTMFFPTRYKKIFKAAYAFSVSRTILRAHWNSDITYGRLIGTMMAPIINALNDTTSNVGNYRLIYQNAYNMALGDDADDIRLRAVYAAHANSPQPSDALTNHQPTVDNPGFFTINIVNNSGKRIMHNGRFKFYTSDNEERLAYYREPSEANPSTLSEFWYWLNPTNYVLEKNATLTISVPIKRIIPQLGTVQDLTGKSFSTTKIGKIYFSTPNSSRDNYLHNSSLSVVDQSGLSDVVIGVGKTFTLSITAALMADVNYWLEDSFNYNAFKALFRRFRETSGETVLVPMRLSEWGQI